MSKPVRRLSQIGRKPLPITTRGVVQTVHSPVIRDPLIDVTESPVLLTKTGEHGLANYVTGSKHSSRRNGNDTHLTSLLRKRRRNVHRHVVEGTPHEVKLLHGKKGPKTLQQFNVFLTGASDTCASRTKQPVNERVFPRKGGYMTVRIEYAFLNDGPKEGYILECISPLQSARQRLQDQLLKVRVITPFNAWALLNSVLRCRCMSPSTISQRTSKLYRDRLFDLRHDLWRNVYRLRDVSGMTDKACSNACRRGNGQSPGTPGEGQYAPGVSPCYTSKPFLQALWDFIHVVDFPVREANVTEGNAKGLHPIAYPIDRTRTGPGDPGPENPTAMLLRKTTGNETCPHRLPGSGMGIDITPMGLLLPST
jgi:hypothetical protein